MPGSIDEDAYSTSGSGGAVLGCAVCLSSAVPPPPAPPPKLMPTPSTTAFGSEFVRFGSNSCPSGSTLLYAGFAAGSEYLRTGGGANVVCLHPEPQWPEGAHSGSQQSSSASMYGVEYEFGATVNQEAACAVCQVDGVGQAYVQWGRASTCTNGHAKLFSGLVLANQYNHIAKSEFV